VLIALVSATPSFAATITFTTDTTGPQANGFVSNDSALASFSDTSGADLLIDDFGDQGNGQALAVFDDDSSKLRIDFSGLMAMLQIGFGNDDEFFTSPGDSAWLQVFNGAVLVGTSSVVMNRDDIMNQFISFSGSPFDGALFWYGNAAGVPIDLIEIVDDITFEPAVAAVPEPASLLLLGSGVVTIAARFRRRQRAN
jgi:hypothetical protein